MKKFVAIPDRDGTNFTKGKEYLITEFVDEAPFMSFRVTSNLGVTGDAYCLEHKCSHINRGDWEIKEIS